MLSLLKKITGTSKATADVMDQHLIISLPNAIDPKIWRMSLEKIGDAAFEIKQDTKSQTYKLVLKPKKGTAEIIAIYDNNKDAINALMAASNALQRSYAPKLKEDKTKKVLEHQGQSSPLQSHSSQSESQKWAIAILGALIVLGLYYYLTTLIPHTAIGFETQNTAVRSTTSAPQDSVGVPVSADDFLNGLQ